MQHINKTIEKNTKAILLNAQSLSKTYHNRGEEPLTILKDINLEIKTQQMYAIIGASGSGKSTLLQNLAGLDDCEGTIEFLSLNLRELNNSWQAILRNQYMGFIYQMHHLIPELTAFENVMVPYWIAQSQKKEILEFAKFVEKKSQSNSHFLEILKQPQKMMDMQAAQQRAEALLTRLGLAARMQYKPSQLSGGERQRVAIARAFINQPLCIFADEPTGNLDRFHANQVFALFKSMVQEEHASLVLVTHDLELAKQCDEQYQLYNT